MVSEEFVSDEGVEFGFIAVPYLVVEWPGYLGTLVLLC